MRGQIAAYAKVGKRYRDDPDFRSRIDGGDVTEALSDLGMDLPSSVEARIVANTADTLHMVLPPDPNAGLSDEALNAVAGGCTGGHQHHPNFGPTVQELLNQHGYGVGGAT